MKTNDSPDQVEQVVVPPPIHFDGTRVVPDELELADGIPALVGDTMVVLKEWTRVTVGAAGADLSALATEEWHWIDATPLLPGIYDCVANLPVAIRDEIERRKHNGISWKRFADTAQFLGAQMISDAALAAEILDVGIASWLQSA